MSLRAPALNFQKVFYVDHNAQRLKECLTQQQPFDGLRTDYGQRLHLIEERPLFRSDVFHLDPEYDFILFYYLFIYFKKKINLPFILPHSKSTCGTLFKLSFSCYSLIRVPSAFAAGWSCSEMPARSVRYPTHSNSTFAPYPLQPPPRRVTLLQFAKLPGKRGLLTLHISSPESEARFLNGATCRIEVLNTGDRLINNTLAAVEAADDVRFSKMTSFSRRCRYPCRGE